MRSTGERANNTKNISMDDFTVFAPGETETDVRNCPVHRENHGRLLTVYQTRRVRANVVDNFPERVERDEGHDGDPDEQPWV